MTDVITDDVLGMLERIEDDIPADISREEQSVNWLLSYVRPMVTEVRRLRADLKLAESEVAAAHRSWQADVARLNAEVARLCADLNEECVRRAVDVENLQAELGAALRARVDDLKAVTTGLANCTPAAAPRAVTREWVARLRDDLRALGRMDMEKPLENRLVNALADLGVTVAAPSGEGPADV